MRIVEARTRNEEALGAGPGSGLVPAALAVVAAGGALAFGGVHTITFSLMEIAVAALALLFFLQTGWPWISRSARLVLGVLLAVPLLQLIPLPAFLVSWLSPARVALARDMFASLAPLPSILTLSANAYATQVATLKLICYVLVFLLAFQFYRLRREQNALVRMLIGLGVVEALYGTVQYLTGWQYIFTYAKKFNTEDATGTYIDHNHFAGLLGMVVPFVLAGILLRLPSPGDSGRARWMRALSSSGSSHFLRDVVLLAILWVGLVFSRSRMGIAAALAGVLLVVALALFQTRRRSTLAVALLVLALPLAYSLWIGLDPVLERFEVLGRPGALETDRLPIWRDTLALIRDYPLLGSGLGTYRWASLRYQSDKLETYYEHAHNDYLEFAADIGIPAAVLLFGSFWLLAAQVSWRALVSERTEKRILAAGCAGAMVAMLTHELTEFNLQMPANAFIFAWIAGTAAALVSPRGTPAAPVAFPAKRYS